MQVLEGLPVHKSRERMRRFGNTCREQAANLVDQSPRKPASTRAATRRAVSSGGLSSVIKIDWGSTISLITKLTPSEIYNIGLALSRKDRHLIAGCRGAPGKEKANLGSNTRPDRINNLEARKQLSSRGTFLTIYTRASTI